eukprot:gene6110-11633_t
MGDTSAGAQCAQTACGGVQRRAELRAAAEEADAAMRAVWFDERRDRAALSARSRAALSAVRQTDAAAAGRVTARRAEAGDDAGRGRGASPPAAR